MLVSPAHLSLCSIVHGGDKDVSTHQLDETNNECAYTKHYNIMEEVIDVQQDTQVAPGPQKKERGTWQG